MALGVLQGVDAIEAEVDPLEGGGGGDETRSRDDTMIPEFEDLEFGTEGEDLRWKSDVVGFCVSISEERDAFDPGSYGGEEERDGRERRRAWVDLSGEGEGEVGEEREVLVGFGVGKRWEGNMVSMVEVVASDLEGSEGRRKSKCSTGDVSPPNP